MSVLFSVTSRLSLADPVWLDLILIELAAAGSSWQSNPNEIKVKISLSRSRGRALQHSPAQSDPRVSSK